MTMTEPPAVFRIDWLPGTDRLRGTCHCGATSEQDDPVRMWDWLLAHPDHDWSVRTQPCRIPPNSA